MPTVIIPAHNEEATILDCLASVESQLDHKDIIVSCNACTDKTVSLVQKHYPKVICLTSPIASKTSALNIAENHVRSWPVFYLDADTRLSKGAINEISNFMDKEGKLLVAPTPVIDISNSSFFVKRFYDVWLDLPYIKSGVIATCTFVVSQLGRSRFKEFPNVIADDNFIRSQFKESEISNVPDAFVYIRAPRDLFSLIKIKTRARLGTIQIRKGGYAQHVPSINYKNVIFKQLVSKKFFSVLIYFFLVSIFKFRASFQYKKIDSYKWESDYSSRTIK